MIFILGSARGSRAGFGGLAETFELRGRLHAEEKVRNGEDAIASTRAACAPRREQSLAVLSSCNLSHDDVAARMKRKLNFSTFRFGVSAVAV
jgi:hypothetical protein